MGVGSAWSWTLTSGVSTYSLHATVPPNGRGRVVVPVAAPSQAIVKEGLVVVWELGSFLPGAVAGIVSATARAGAVVFEVGSGSYMFMTIAERDRFGSIV